MAQKNRKRAPQKLSSIFQAVNYKLMIIGILLVAAGFASMYIEDSVNGIVPIYISPILILAGYVVVIFAIIKRAGKQPSQHSPGQ